MSVFDREIADVTARLAPVWPRLAGARIFWTGGTGFIGRWMIEALVRSGTPAEIVLLSRDPAAFAARAPHLMAHCQPITGDVTQFTPPAGSFSHIIHGATDASAWLTANDPRRMFDTIVGGTRRVLDVAASAGSPRVLFLSSGAVYGNQPANCTHLGEDWPGGPDPRDPRSAYAEGKRAAETLCAIYARQFGIDVVTARIFALLGPLLALDTHFAAGNFIRDAMAGKTIRVESSGEAVRSYIYAADLTVWLWTMFADAAPGATYNVGSEHGITIADLARRTARLLGAPDVEILGQPDPGWNPGRYVPSTAAIRRDLGLCAATSLDEAIMRTALFHGWNP